MWRQHGGGLAVFSALAAVTFTLIGSGLIGLFVSFIQPTERTGIKVLLSLTLLTGAAAFLLLFFQFFYHQLTARSGRLEMLERARLEAWLAYSIGEGPVPPRDVMSAAALARLREIAIGRYSEDLATMYEQHGFLRRDIDSLSKRWYGVRRRALSRLGQVRSAGAVPALQVLLSSGHQRLAAEALRALARSLDTDKITEERARREFVAACDARSFTPGEIESALVLTGRHSAALVRHLLTSGRDTIAALAVLGHKNLLELVPLLGGYLSTEDPEIRAAALRAVAKIELAPSGSIRLILAGLGAKESFVRAQAAKASVTVPLSEARGPLIRALGDSDWWVRRNAAASLAAFGPAGMAVLASAALSHSDAFARDVARRAAR